MWEEVFDFSNNLVIFKFRSRIGHYWFGIEWKVFKLSRFLFFYSFYDEIFSSFKVLKKLHFRIRRKFVMVYFEKNLYCICSESSKLVVKSLMFWKQMNTIIKTDEDDEDEVWKSLKFWAIWWYKYKTLKVTLMFKT